jgi:predicted AAA+ superfamily ATPase
MESYIKRIVENKIVENLKIFRCISIVGPKFCGKTEMSLKHCASSINISIDSNKKTAEIMPSSILIGSTPRLIDE